MAPTAAPAQNTAATTQLFLPLVSTSATDSIFGIEMARLDAANGLGLVTTSGTVWVRRNALRWRDIEPVRGGGYTWDNPQVQVIEQELIRANELGLRVILIVRGSPTWAVAPYDSGCAPINPAAYADFARFMAALVQRYSAQPYGVRYWEIGNEPDAPISPDNVYGCWGQQDDPYYGGQAYGEMIKVVVPAMKAVNPAIKILNGGLLLDHPYIEGDPSTNAGRFFEGILTTSAGRYLDIISFHTYFYYNLPGQPTHGPSIDWRVAYLRDLLRRYQLPEMPMIRSETALLCYDVTPECRWAQADSVGRMFARSARDGMLATVWYVYDNDSFHNTAMIEPGSIWVPRPTYFAYRHAASLLSGSRYVGPIPGLSAAAEGYLFTRGTQQIYIYWTDATYDIDFSIPAPAGASIECTIRDGGPVPCAAADGSLSLTAKTSPAFVTINP
ncbi:hypothetical protein EKD04_013945 [Chloroflexales bacterium ZM16-3]|nr:hypothetical protein [Chloroflexales bacterium ZM16-3]